MGKVRKQMITSFVSRRKAAIRQDSVVEGMFAISMLCDMQAALKYFADRNPTWYVFENLRRLSTIIDINSGYLLCGCIPESYRRGCEGLAAVGGGGDAGYPGLNV
jgi:hypothetical protein